MSKQSHAEHPVNPVQQSQLLMLYIQSSSVFNHGPSPVCKRALGGQINEHCTTMLPSIVQTVHTSELSNIQLAVAIVVHSLK